VGSSLQTPQNLPLVKPELMSFGMNSHEIDPIDMVKKNVCVPFSLPLINNRRPGHPIQDSSDLCASTCREPTSNKVEPSRQEHTIRVPIGNLRLIEARPKAEEFSGGETNNKRLDNHLEGFSERQ
jgi:hypothetical protein